MRRKEAVFYLLILSLTFCSLDNLAAEPGSGGNALFINSNPIGADILIDGRAVLKKTPALIRNIEPGSRRISLRKDDFHPLDIDVTVTDGSVNSIKPELLRK